MEDQLSITSHTVIAKRYSIKRVSEKGNIVRVKYSSVSSITIVRPIK